ncbi:hypothetical protein ES319_A13G087300v1 [Gossypium barbadense]|uniref:Uncharacterized protein n=2 Tax=Gossypium TaxID=3633 RepID=A0A5J5SWS3_GOSBA|nr:hypothetical protein ES319_A13G087300v1 [Gossypium barbadense]KAB2048045.1 hypothetical protein ES319_A13G087300v1 [Gossypium barbadense]TYG85898.1 hypothetical protein ES288_A13G091800v1 [Gossypium darwinii]TYG85899.1 hypothetical protein ES288_A13G091800v1 [Gossypium darwinii]
MKELKLKPPLLTFRAWIWATGTALDLKPNYVRAWANMGISYANQVSFCWMHGLGLAEFMHSDDLFELIADLKVCILSLFCSFCILLDFWCSMISAVFCLTVIDKLSIWWDIYLYHRYYSSSQYFDNEF